MTMNITIMSMAGSVAAEVLVEPDWLVSSIVECVRERRGLLSHHIKLVFEGRTLPAHQSVVEAGLFDGAALHAIQMPGPQPGKYRGFHKDQDDYAEDRVYVHTTYILAISEDGSFTLERTVCSNLNSALTEKSFNGQVRDDGFAFVDQLDEDVVIEIGAGGRPLLRASVDTVDGDIVGKAIGMKPCDETSWARQNLGRLPPPQLGGH